MLFSVMPAVVHDDVARIVVLVESFALLHDGESQRFRKYIHRPLSLPILNLLPLPLVAGVLVEEAVLIAHAVFHDDGFVVAPSSVFLEEHVPSVIRVQISGIRRNSCRRLQKSLVQNPSASP